jgi:hypothetical protein
MGAEGASSFCLSEGDTKRKDIHQEPEGTTLASAIALLWIKILPGNALAMAITT